MSPHRHINVWRAAGVSPADVRQALDRFIQHHDHSEVTTAARHWAPRVDIREDDSQSLILAEIPGVDPA